MPAPNVRQMNRLKDLVGSNVIGRMSAVVASCHVMKRRRPVSCIHENTAITIERLMIAMTFENKLDEILLDKSFQ